MDIQTLKPIFLDYFYEQMRKNEEIEIDSLVSMAQNVEIAAKTIDELFSEGLIEGISIKWNDERPLFQSSHDAKLTEKGIKQVARKNAFGDFFHEQASTQDEKQKPPKRITAENLINRAEKQKKQKINSLSIEEKYDAIKKEILIFFCDLTQTLPDIDGKPYTLYKIRGKLREIESKYFPSSGYHLEYIINQVLYKNELIRYRHGRKFIAENENLGFENFITDKGIKYLEENYSYCFNKPLGEMTDKEFKSTFGNPVNSLSKALLATGGFPANITPLIGKISGQLNVTKALQNSMGLNASALKLAQQMAGSNYLKAAQSAVSSGAVQAASEALKLHGTYGKSKSKEKEDNYEEDTSASTFTFEGILGQNCGKVILPDSQDIKRIKVKGFKVVEGIKVLRGFVKSSILAEFSKPDENYQRDKQPKHLKSLTKFMNEMRVSAKYLPEVTLVARGYENLSPVSFSGSLNDTQKGELENLDYWKLTVDKTNLFRIDGNHRIEATKDDDFYIPFSIIIWDASEVNQDDEAFLFYFLNSKAKKLTTEENLKGLVDAKNWEDHELELANPLLPYLRHFRKNFESHKLFKKDYYKNSIGEENVKSQILNVLEIILKEEKTQSLSFDLEVFDKYISETQEILSQKDRFKYLRTKFRCFPQIVFYTLYKKQEFEDTIKFLSDTDNWAKYYKHDTNSFMAPDKLYFNAYNQLNKKIKIFVAMPYYNKPTVGKFNKTIKSLIEKLCTEHNFLENRLELCEIMTYKAESTDILSKMDKEITECDIFIADISMHNNVKANPNVMYELGRVVGKAPFLLIRKNTDKHEDVPFDIAPQDYIPIDYGMGFDESLEQELKPRILEISRKILGFNIE